jgi:hypothetical protein
MPFDEASRKCLAETKAELQVPEVASDHVLLLRALDAWEAAPNRSHFAETHGMSPAALGTLRSTRDQLGPAVMRAAGLDHASVNRHDSVQLIAACVAMGLYPNVGWRVPPVSGVEPSERAKRTLVTSDGHRATIGRDSINGDTVLGPLEFAAYFERVALRGTLVLQDTTLTGPLPFLLASTSLIIDSSTGTTVLKADGIIEAVCPVSQAALLVQTHAALQGALYFAASGEPRRIPRGLLQALAILLAAPPPPPSPVPSASVSVAPRQVATPIAPRAIVPVAYPTAGYPTAARPAAAYPSASRPAGGYPTVAGYSVSARPAAGYPAAAYPTAPHMMGTPPPLYVPAVAPAWAASPITQPSPQLIHRPTIPDMPPSRGVPRYNPYARYS